MEIYISNESTPEANIKKVKDVINEMHAAFKDVNKQLQFITDKGNQLYSMVEKEKK